MIYHCGEFALNDRLFELRRAGQRVAVQPKILDLLLFMIRSRSRIVSKEEIFSALRGNVVTSKNVLSTAMPRRERSSETAEPSGIGPIPSINGRSEPNAPSGGRRWEG